MSEHNQAVAEQSNSPGGISMFRDIDQSGALCHLAYNLPESKASLESLENWFSTPRLHRYAAASRPDLLYIWNARLSKAFLERVSDSLCAGGWFISSARIGRGKPRLVG